VRRVDNPYAPSHESSRPSCDVRYIDWIAWVCFLPFVIAIYACWIITYVTLSRSPIPGRDLPGEVGGVVMKIAVSTANIAAAYTFPVIGIAILLQLLLPGVRFRTRLKRIAVTVIIPVLLMIAMALDPSGALRWLVFSNA
jgi:hypothetical protein